MKTIPATQNVLVLRTDFSDNNSWDALCDEIKIPHSDFGFVANVAFCSDKEFESLTVEQVLSNLSKDYRHSIIFIADNITISNQEHPVMCLDLSEQVGKYFRVIPAEMWGVENNLSIANMDFYEFAKSVEPDGIFRGF